MKANNSIEEPKWEALVRYLTGEADSVEANNIEIWAAASDQNNEKLNEIRQLLTHTDDLLRLNSFNTDLAWNHVESKIHGATSVSVSKNSIRKLSVWVYKYAAVLVLLITLGAAGYFYFKPELSQLTNIRIYTENNEILNNYMLPDGSTVALNRNSILTYPVDFNKEIREITLTGEGFFDIKPNSSKPFIINAGDASIRVLGTSFSVDSYPGNDSLEVVVTTGIVQVAYSTERSVKKKEIILQEGEKGILVHSTGNLEKSDSIDPNYLAWKTHYFSFNQTPLEQVIKILQEVFHTEIKLHNDELNNLMLTAQFDNKPEKFILDVICLTFDLELAYRNNSYILSKKSVSNN